MNNEADHVKKVKGEKLYVLGTGSATVTKCYNTCFTLFDGQQHVLIDAGGGNGILSILESQGISFQNLACAYLTHRHSDHMLGMVWIIRVVGTLVAEGKRLEPFKIFCHEEVARELETVVKSCLDKKVTQQLGTGVQIVPVQNGDDVRMGSYVVTVFDIHSTKTKQFGFTLSLHNGQKLTCLGDEPYTETSKEYVMGTDWLLSEAFCLYRDRDIFKPYEKHHSTVREACVLAEKLDIPHLVLWHTEDTQLARRKELYSLEGHMYYQGELYIPDDGDIIDL